MKKLFNLSAKVGNRKDGSAIYLDVGVILEDENGPFMLLNKTFNPAGVPDADPQKSSVKIRMFEPKPYDDKEFKF
jgi:hypothetical protein